MFMVGALTRKRVVESDVVLLNASHVRLSDLEQVTRDCPPRADDKPVVIEYRRYVMVLA